jgi:hypothetical protein
MFFTVAHSFQSLLYFTAAPGAFAVPESWGNKNAVQVQSLHSKEESWQHDRTNTTTNQTLYKKDRPSYNIHAVRPMAVV